MKIILKLALVVLFLGAGGYGRAGADEAADFPATPDLATGNKLDLREGMRIYKTSCAECHATGKGGAPRLRDAAAWRERSFQSFSVMEKHARKGFLSMPAKGKHPLLTDQDVANAVFYMEDQIADRQENGPR